MEIDTQFLFSGVIVTLKLGFQGLDQVSPEGGLHSSKDDSMFYVLRQSRPERWFGEDDEMVPVKVCQVDGGHGERTALRTEVGYVSLDSPV